MSIPLGVSLIDAGVSTPMTPGERTAAVSRKASGSSRGRDNSSDGAEAKHNHATPAHGTTSAWGRSTRVPWTTSLGALCIMLFAPLVVWLFLWSCAEHDCSLLRSTRVLAHLVQNRPFSSYAGLWNPLEVITKEAVAIWTAWMALQIMLYSFVPGPREYGQPTPGGHTLQYVVNGLRCWVLTHGVVLVAAYAWFGTWPAVVVVRNWLPLFWISCLVGWSLALASYAKARLWPTHANDVKLTGSFFYDLYMGCELNPRLSSHPLSFDFKLFFNGRPGILAWTLINVAFAMVQWTRFGAVNNSMIILNLLQAIYVIDFFWNEGWYLRTIDIAHDHFGFYLAWGDLCWLPFMYTLQGLFLSSHFVHLTPLGCAFTLGLGLGGYALFRKCNAEKDAFRKEMRALDAHANGGVCTDEKTQKREDAPRAHAGKPVTWKGQAVYELEHFRLWGAPTRYLSARYHTGALHEPRQSYLLVSGCWGVSRHMNYLGDLLLSLAMCCCCGFTHALPFFYFAFMTTLLVHRVARDDERCRAKYGKHWEQYCSIVRYKIIPYVY